MQTPVDYTSTSQQRILKLIPLLAGHEFTGITPGQLAKSAGISASNATRDLFNLKQAGLAELVPDTPNRWRLGPLIINVALAHLNCRDRAASRLTELDKRYGRTI